MRQIRILAALAAMTGASPAHALLERVGPNNPTPSVGGYPAWYQDQTGLTLEFCDPRNQAEVDGGWCLLLAGDVPTVPEAFPASFFDEHFYFSAGASLSPLPVGNKASLVLAVEGAFAGGPPAVGDQITFARIRVRLNSAPVAGTYRFIHPYGEEIFRDVQAGDRIFFTEDVGINCPPGGPFDCALASRLGPFLVPSAFPGGPETAPVAGPVPGKLYLAEPARLGPVTGSALPDFVDSTGALRNHNIFRIEGPPGSGLGSIGQDWIETVDFTLMGRVFTQTIPGRVTVDRAGYERTASQLKVDVFASGFPTTQGRLPPNPRPAAVLPQLGFFPAPCTVGANGALSAPAGSSEVQMFNEGSAYWGQTQPAALPTDVCVEDAAARDANGNVAPAFFSKQVSDEVTISEALYDPAQKLLSVKATSSDALVPPILNVAGFGAIPATGRLVVSPLAAPGAKVTVLSSAGGAADLATKVSLATAAPPVGPVAVNDAVTFAEDSGTHVISVLANDSGAAGGTVAIVTRPRLGTAALRPDGGIDYTPSPNASGADGLSYTVTVGGVTSNVGNVSITLTGVNDAPVAVPDGPLTVLAGVPTALNLLANDGDPDGAADLVGVQVVTQPVGAVATAAPGGAVIFTAAAAGTFTFTYRAVDASGAASVLPATVTVNAIGGEVVAATSALFRTGQKRWVVTGTDSLAGLDITLSYVDGQFPGRVIGKTTAVGNAWTFDVRGVSGAVDPTTLNPRPTQLRATSSAGGSGTVSIVFRN